MTLPSKELNKNIETVNEDASAPTVSIIIASYNARDVLAACLESIYDHRPRVPFEVIVVDDASVDDTSHMVHERFPQVHALRNDQNVHYGKSVNRALGVARGRFVYLLNNDIIMLPGAVDDMVDFLERHPEVGAVGSKLLNEDGTVQWSVKSLPNPASALFGARSLITRLFPRNPVSRRHLLHLSHDMTRPFAAGYVSSASIMLPRKVIDRVGGLDERLSYHVDADYCRRITDAGWTVYYLPTVAVIHLNHRGGTLVNRRRRFKSIVEFHRGSYIYHQKHMMKSPWSLMHLAVLVGLGGRFLVSLALQAVAELFHLGRRDLASKNSPQVPSAGRDDNGVKSWKSYGS